MRVNKKRSLKTGRTLQINAFNLENQINWNRNNKKKHIHHQVSFREYKQYIDYFQNSHFLSRKKNEVVKNIEYLHFKYNYFFLSKSFNSYSMSHISQTYEVQNIQTTMWFLHVLILLLIIRWIFCIKRINKLIFQQADDCYSNT
jgi:hypothetical protein